MSDTRYMSDLTTKGYLIGSIWRDSYDLGSKIAETPRLFINQLVYFLAYYFDLSWNEEIVKIFFIGFFIVFSSISVFALIYELSKNIFLSFVSSLLYTYSSVNIASLAMGHIHLLVPIGILPLIIYLIIKIKDDKLSFLFIHIFLFISIIYDLRYTLQSYAIYLLVFTVVSKLNTKKNTIYLISSLFVFALLNIYWILPEMISGSLSGNPIINRSAFEGMGMNIIYSIINQHPFLSVNTFKVFSKQNYQIIFFVLPTLVIFSLYKYTNLKSKLQKNLGYTFAFILVLSIFFAKQDALPYFGSYSLLLDYIKPLSIFREGTRYLHIIMISALLIISIYYNSLRNIYFKISIVILISFCAIYLITPIINYQKSGVYENKTPNLTYQEIEDTLLKDYGVERYKILYIPQVSIYATHFNTNPVVNFTTFINTNNLDDNDTIIKNKGEFVKYLNAYNIKYAIIPSFYIQFDHKYSENFSPQIEYKTFLDEIGLNLVAVIPTSKDNIYVYKNEDYDPFISINNPNTVDYSYVKPYQYELKFNQIQENLELTIANKYDKGWVLIPVKDVNKFSILSIFRKSPKDINFEHLIDEFGRNKFIIEIKGSDQNINNNKTFENLSAVLFYKPQVYFQIGSIITLISVITLILLTLIVITKKHINVNSKK